MKKSSKPPLPFGIKTLSLIYPLSKYLYFRSVNSVFVVILLFLFFYMRLCNNDSGNEGIKYFERGEYNIAMEYYNEYLTLYPHHVETLYNRGRCFEVLGYPDKAADDYLLVLDKDPDNVKALLSLSQYYYKKGKYKSTVNLCQYAINIDEDNYLAHYYKARAHHKSGDFSKALEEYNSVVDINPDYGFAYFQRGSLLLSIEGLRPFGCYDLVTADCLKVKGSKEAWIKYCR